MTNRRRSSSPMPEPPPHVPPTERALLESVPDVVYRYRLRPPPGLEHVNPSSTAVTGYTPEEHYADPTGSTHRAPGRHVDPARRHRAAGSKRRLPAPLAAQGRARL